MMHPMGHKMQSHEEPVVGQEGVQMEQKAVERVLNQSPIEEPRPEAEQGGGEGEDCRSL